MTFTYELKNMKEIKIEDNELILIWNKNDYCATQMRFCLEDILALGVELKPKKEKDNE